MTFKKPEIIAFYHIIFHVSIAVNLCYTMKKEVHSMKKIGLALLCLLMACGVSAMVLYGIWNQYNPTAIIGSSIQTENTDVKEVTEQWFDEFFKQYEGPFVPFEFRIRDKE